jgi:hypothetical protein
MAKPWIHAVSSSKKWGGTPEEYVKFHDWMDQTKSHIADSRHRAILHNSFGIYLGEQFFGTTFKNSNGRDVPVRSILELHVLEDYNGFIPTLQDFVSCMKYEQWMNGKGRPPSNPQHAPSNQEVENSLNLMKEDE